MQWLNNGAVIAQIKTIVKEDNHVKQTKTAGNRTRIQLPLVEELQGLKEVYG